MHLQQTNTLLILTDQTTDINNKTNKQTTTKKSQERNPLKKNKQTIKLKKKKS